MRSARAGSRKGSSCCSPRWVPGSPSEPYCCAGVFSGAESPRRTQRTLGSFLEKRLCVLGVLCGDVMVNQASRLDGLRALQRWLDEAFRVPGTSIRFGWDPIIGLVPWAGDVLTAMVGCAIVLQAHQMRVPRVVQLRMLLNVGIDLVVGIVPFVGDAADFLWKSNAKNFALL